MKVVVTASGPDLNSPVDPRFGRARYFILVDTDTRQFSAHDNSDTAEALQGAGTQSAQRAVALGAEAILTGNVGPKAFVGLRAAGIPVYSGASGTVQQAIDEFCSGRLGKSEQPNVQGRW